MIFIAHVNAITEMYEMVYMNLALMYSLSSNLPNSSGLFPGFFVASTLLIGIYTYLAMANYVSCLALVAWGTFRYWVLSILAVAL